MIKIAKAKIFEKDQTTKRLVVVALVSTTIALLIWGFYFFKLVERTENSLPKTGGQIEDSSTLHTFDIQFSEEELNIGLNEELFITLILNGSTEDVVSAQTFLKYDPNIIEVISQNESDLFDFYMGNTINSEQGIVSLSGALTTIGSKDNGSFATLQIKRKAEGETQLTILGELQEKEGSKQYSKAVTVYGSSYSLQNKSISVK